MRRRDLVVLGYLDAPAMGLHSRTPALTERLLQRREFHRRFLIKFPCSWFRPPPVPWEPTAAQTWMGEWRMPLPEQKASWLNVVNGPFVAQAARRLEASLKAFDVERYVLWTPHPLMARYAQHLSPDAWVFDAIDDFAHHPQLKSLKAAIEHGYRIARDHADLILTTSEALPAHFEGTSALIKHLPNGVDWSFFLPRGGGPPPAMAAIPSPRVGYVGILQERFDTELVAYLAKRFPSLSFVLIGPIYCHASYFEPLRAFSNVHFLGAQPYSLLPTFLEHMDVCILPHRLNPFTQAMNPLKLYEYLAAGRPVVSTPIPPAPRFSPMVRVAETPQAFAQELLEALLRRDHPQERDNRLALARENAWEERAAEVAGLLSRLAAPSGMVPPPSAAHWELGS